MLSDVTARHIMQEGFPYQDMNYIVLKKYNIYWSDVYNTYFCHLFWINPKPENEKKDTIQWNNKWKQI